MEKYVDYTAEVSQGGRVEKYWYDKGVKKPFASTLNPSDTLNNNPIAKAIKKYKLKSVEFGNYMSQADRHDRFLAFCDAMPAFSKVIGTENVGMDCMLSVAFGARGRGGRAAAFFQTFYQIINITKQHNNTFAHEYGHAIDCIIGTYIDQDKSNRYLTGGSSVAKNVTANTALRMLANEVVNKANLSPNRTRWEAAGDYWIERTEIFARMFEQYVAYTMGANYNKFLSSPYSFYTGNKAYVDDAFFKKNIAPAFRQFLKAFAAACNGRKIPVIKAKEPIKTAAKVKTKTAKKTTAKPKAKKGKQLTLFSKTKKLK